MKDYNVKVILKSERVIGQRHIIIPVTARDGDEAKDFAKQIMQPAVRDDVSYRNRIS